jgi:hypothetical protein
MTSQNPQPDIYDPKTLAVMDQAFAAIWNVLRADDPFRDFANDSELRIAIGHKLLNPVADGVTDLSQLRHLKRACVTNSEGRQRGRNDGRQQHRALP